MKHTPHTIFSKIAVLVVALCAVSGISYLEASWTDAPADPPSNNVPSVLTTSAQDEVKSGRLTLDSLWVFGEAALQGSLSVNTASNPGGVSAGVSGRVTASEYCDENGNNCGGIEKPAAELIWEGYVGDANNLDLMPGKNFSDYDAIHYKNHESDRELHGEVPYALFAAKPSYWFLDQSFSGDDSGYNGIQYVDDTTFNTNGYRGGRLRELWGVNKK